MYCDADWDEPVVIEICSVGRFVIIRNAAEATNWIIGEWPIEEGEAVCLIWFYQKKTGRASIKLSQGFRNPTYQCFRKRWALLPGTRLARPKPERGHEAGDVAQIYGSRWKIIDGGLGKGGQGDVFRVKDLSGELDGIYALKRLINPKRRWRFENEIRAIERLDHPNIVRLIDKSAYIANIANPAKPKKEESDYLVMPIAEFGDLSQRPKLFHLNPKATLDVALSLAQALAYAHDSGVIHRDVKPQNILFAEQDHSPWLADFGLCLLRDQPERGTEEGEEVGPAKYMAPELEGGQVVDVQPDADVYSLGKVIYYMLSGGKVLPREDWHRQPYSNLFSHGEQFGLIEGLLSKMICSHESRIQTMDEVIARIQSIQQWPTEAAALPPQAIASFGKLQRTVALKNAKDLTNSEIMSRREARERRLLDGVLGHIVARLEQLAKTFSIPDNMSAKTRNFVEPIDGPGLRGFKPRASTEVGFINNHENVMQEHVLRITIFSAIQYSDNIAATALSQASLEEEHTEFALILSYRRDHLHSPHKSAAWFNTHETGLIGLISEAEPQPLRLSTSDWTNNRASIDQLVSAGIVGFAKVIGGE